MKFTDLFKRDQAIRIEEEPLPPPVTHTTNTNTSTTTTPSSSTSPFNVNFSNLNPFKNYGPIQLPLTEEAEEQVTNESGPLNLSKWDRLIIFGIFLLGAVVCYAICIFMFPILSLKPRKFISLWTLGSVFFLVSFAVLQGFTQYVKHLFSGPRIAFTAAFLGSIGLTMYSSLVLHSTVLAIVFAVVQLVAQLSYTVSYFPFGRQTLGFTSRVALSQAESWINS